MNPGEYQIVVLGHRPEEFTEYRNINGGKFVGINPRKTKDGRTNQDVVRVSCIVIDIDNASDPINQAKTIVLLENYSSYVIVSSGRGAHIYVPVDLPLNSDIKGYLKSLDETYGKECKIDSIGDHARVIRVWGSINEKNGQLCQVIEDHFNGINTFKLPVFKKYPLTNASLSGIINGNRNNTLTSLAGSMHRKGFTKEAIEAALVTENKQKCVPPLDEIEVKNIVQSISRYQVPAVNQQFKSMTTLAENYIKSLDQRKPGYSTGFNKLDHMLAGLQKGKLYVLAARTNEGKTSFACNISYNLVKQNISVLYFPTELGYEPLFDKLTARVSETPLKAFQFGNFTIDEKQKIVNTTQILQTLPFNVYESFALTLAIFKEKSKDISPNLIILDFIQAMKYEEGSPAEIAANVRGIKEIADELQVPIILCCQLNRAAINNELSLSQLKGSGAIEEFADVVMALSTVSKYEYPRIVDLHILKNRYSEIGKVRMNFYSSIGKFEEQETK